MNPAELLIVDGTALLFKMYFAPGSQRSQSGIEVGGVVGVTRGLVNLVREHSPSYVAVVFDAGQRTFRNELFEPYKQNRGAPPEDLIPQFDLTYEAVQKLGFQVFNQVGFEADDLVATLARIAHEQGVSVTMVTDDKDITGLIRESDDATVSQWLYSKKKRLRTADVIEKYGVTPDQMVDYLSMIGDASDNIPGIKGIGPKTASQLLSHFGTLEQLIDGAESITELSIRGAKSVALKVTNGAETALQAKQLIQLVDTVPIEVTEISQLSLSAPNDEAEGFFEALNAGYIVRRLNAFLVEREGLL